MRVFVCPFVREWCMCLFAPLLESDAEHSYGEVNQEDKRSIAFDVWILCARANLQWRSQQCPPFFFPICFFSYSQRSLSFKRQGPRAFPNSQTCSLVLNCSLPANILRDDQRPIEGRKDTAYGPAEQRHLADRGVGANRPMETVWLDCRQTATLNPKP